MAWVKTLDITQPVGASAKVPVLDNYLRDNLEGIRERLDGNDVYMPLTGTQISDTSAGKHRKVTYKGLLTVKPTLLADETALYTKEVDGKWELFWENEDGTEKQLTTLGKLNVAATDLLADLIDDTKVRLRNAQYLRARNAAGTGDISLIEANASDKPQLPDGAVLATSTAPTVDAGIPNKKYVDDAKPDIYRSAWTAVAANSSYAFTHGLGALPDIVRIYYSDTSDGSGDVVTCDGYNASDRWMVVCDMTTTVVTVRSGPYGVASYRDSVGGVQVKASGYAKVVAVKYN